MTTPKPTTMPHTELSTAQLPHNSKQVTGGVKAALISTSSGFGVIFLSVLVYMSWKLYVRFKGSRPRRSNDIELTSRSLPRIPNDLATLSYRNEDPSDSPSREPLQPLYEEVTDHPIYRNIAENCVSLQYQNLFYQ